MQTVLHEVGHYVSLRADRSIIDAYTDAIYPTDATLSAAGVPFVIDRLSSTRWHNHAKKRVYERNPEYKKFEGFELHFLPDDKPTWVGMWEYLTSIGDKRMKEPMRYVKPGT